MTDQLPHGGRSQPAPFPQETPGSSIFLPEASANTGETTTVYTWEVESVPDTLRRIADELDADESALLLSLTNTPAEPSDPWLFIIQAVITRQGEPHDHRN